MYIRKEKPVTRVVEENMMHRIQYVYRSRLLL